MAVEFSYRYTQVGGFEMNYKVRLQESEEGYMFMSGLTLLVRVR